MKTFIGHFSWLWPQSLEAIFPFFLFFMGQIGQGAFRYDGNGVRAVRINTQSWQ